MTHEEASSYEQTIWCTRDRLVDSSFHECGHAEPTTIPAVFDAHVTHASPATLVQQMCSACPRYNLKNHTDNSKTKTLKATSQNEGGSVDTNLGPSSYCSSSSTTWVHPVPLFVNHTSVTVMSARSNNWMNKFASQIWLARHQGNQLQQMQCSAPEHNYSAIRCLVQCAKCNTCQGYDNFGFGLVSTSITKFLYFFFFKVVSSPFVFT